MTLIIDNASLIYQGARHKGDYILKNINLEIRDGEFTCLLGPSGCGKSSLLGLIAGFVRTSTGELLMHGQKITRPDINRTLIFQEYALFPWLNVIENVAFGLKYQIKSKEERFAQASKYLRMVGLIDHAKDSISQLSGGMKQRVAIARAFVVKPDLLLMDEPFGALDDQSRSNMQKLITEIWSELKTTIVFVTHSIDEALMLADRIIIMGKSAEGTGHGEIKADINITSLRPRSLVDMNDYRTKILNVLYDNQSSANVGFDPII
jgi:NitT/TauT family transport system ATP-binding protein